MLQARVNRSFLAVAAVILVVLVGTSFAQTNQRARTTPGVRWEYHTLITKDPRGPELNNLGRDGWELVGLEHQRPKDGVYFVCVFKRPVL